jgi:hypothetical protein
MLPRRLPIRLLAAAAVFGAVWELCARLDAAIFEGAPLVGGYGLSALMTSDRFGVTGRPYARFSRWTMNSLGFRGGELRVGRERILCIGASETFGMYEPEGLEFPRQLETELNRRARAERFEVVNAGLPGQSLSGFARRAAAVVREVQPRIAVIYPSPALYIQPPPENYTAGPARRDPLFQPRIVSGLSARFGEVAPEAVQTGLRRLAIWALTRGATVRNRVPEENVRRFRRDLARLLDLLAGERVRVVLATHCTRFGASVTARDTPTLVAWRTLYPTLEESGFLDMESRMNAVVRGEAASRGLILVDAAPWLDGPENFVEFEHFTATGAGALARALADGMQSGGALE